MQNTNTTNIIANSATIKERKQPVTPLPQINLDSRGGLYEIKKQDTGLLRKIIKFLSGIFTGKILKSADAKQMIELGHIIEHKSIIMPERQVEKPINEDSSIQATPQHELSSPKTYHDDFMRKLAEHQFMNMDVSQVSRN